LLDNYIVMKTAMPVGGSVSLGVWRSGGGGGGGGGGQVQALWA